MKYTATPISISEQLELLKTRGLKIKDIERAKRYLNNVGYFRLAGYMKQLQSDDGSLSFIGDVYFEDIINLYHFDKKLKAIIIEYLERIEVAVRAKMNNKYSLKYGFFWYINSSLFADQKVFNDITKEIKDTFDVATEGFLKNFKNKYTEEAYPPSNMALETLSFGKLAKLYGKLKRNSEKAEIASEFKLIPYFLESWLVYLARVRNVCAHHARLWNIQITVDRPLIPSRDTFKFNGTITTDFNTTMYGIISIINRLLLPINPTNSFTQQIENLIKDHLIDTSLMGFPADWKTNAHWHKENAY